MVGGFQGVKMEIFDTYTGTFCTASLELPEKRYGHTIGENFIPETLMRIHVICVYLFILFQILLMTRKLFVGEAPLVLEIPALGSPMTMDLTHGNTMLTFQEILTNILLGLCHLGNYSSWEILLDRIATTSGEGLTLWVKGTSPS